MGSGMYDGMFEALIIGSVIVGALIATVLFFVVPWLWGYIKPMLHAITA